MAYYCSKCGSEIYLRETSCPRCHTSFGNVSAFSVYADKIGYYIFSACLIVVGFIMLLLALGFLVSGQIFVIFPWTKVTAAILIFFLCYGVTRAIYSIFKQIPDISETSPVLLFGGLIIASIVNYFFATVIYPDQTGIKGVAGIAAYGLLPFLGFFFFFCFAVEKVEDILQYLFNLLTGSNKETDADCNITASTRVLNQKAVKCLCQECGANVDVDQEQCVECGHYLFHS